MAELFGVFGKIRGKLGSSILRIDRGKNLISAYNPSKSGVPSSKQVESRVRLSTASALSRFFPLQAIVGFSPEHSRARSRFLASLIGKCEVTQVDEQTMAGLINAENIVLSAGIPVITLSTSLLPGTRVEPAIIASIKFALNQGVRRFLLVALGQNVSTEEYYAAQFILSGEVLENGACSAQLPLASNNSLADVRYYCYAIPMVTDTEHKRVVYNRVLEGSPEGDFTAQAAITFAKADIYRASIYLGMLEMQS